MDSKPINVRRWFKYLIKDYSRDLISNELITRELMSRGFIGNIKQIRNILRTRIKSKVISRMGKAALKKNDLLSLNALYCTWRAKEGFFVYHWDIKDYHLIPFTNDW